MAGGREAFIQQRRRSPFSEEAARYLKDVFSVAGKVTIVTGGGTGIGIAIAREFALRDAPVLIASRNAGHLEPVRDEIRKLGGTCEMTVCDVRDAAQCDAMIATAVKHFGRLDVMINNHGASITAPSMNLSANAWRVVVAINLDGTFHCSKAAARQFIEQKSGGSIINLGSTAGVRGSATMLPYSASKAAVAKLTECHAAEWGHHQIRVNCIAPGPVTHRARRSGSGPTRRSRTASCGRARSAVSGFPRISPTHVSSSPPTRRPG